MWAGPGPWSRARQEQWVLRWWWPRVGCELEPGAAERGGQWAWETQCCLPVFQLPGSGPGDTPGTSASKPDSPGLQQEACSNKG